MAKSLCLALALLVSIMASGQQQIPVIEVTQPLAAEIQVVDTPKYVEFRIPFRDMYDYEKRLAIREGTRILVEGIRSRFPDGKIDQETLTRLAADPDYLGQTVRAVRSWVSTEKLIGVKVIPSAFLLYLGGKFSANLKIGGGGSVVGAVVLVPMEIIRINKLTARTVTRRWVFDATAVGITNVDVGVGGGSAFRVGVGLVWGDLDRASEFRGVSAGVSASGSWGIGMSGKIHVLLNQVNLPRIAYLLIGYDAGVQGGAEAHLGAGGVVPLGNILKTWLGDVDAGKIYAGYNVDGGEVETVASINEARTGAPR